jgi:hypothetical protein
MTEAEWLTCADIKDMVVLLNERLTKLGTVPQFDSKTDRKFRLYACAVCRHGDHFTDPASRQLLDVLERFLDGQISQKQLDAARQSFVDAWQPPARLRSEPVTDYNLEDLRPLPWPKPILDFAARGGLFADGGAWNAGCLVGQVLGTHLLREVFGNPFRARVADPRWAVWNHATIPRLARTIYETGGFDQLPVLADALEEAGCTDAVILGHCRGPGPHVRGCWVVDLVLGKE